MKVTSIRLVEFQKPVLPGAEDLLRYDLGFVHPKFPSIVAFIRFSTVHGALGGLFTYDRWRSYGFLSQQGEPNDPLRRSEFLMELNGGPSAFVTYRHPRVGVSPFTKAEYGVNLPYSLRIWLDHKSTQNSPHPEPHESEALAQLPVSCDACGDFALVPRDFVAPVQAAHQFQHATA